MFAVIFSLAAAAAAPGAASIVEPARGGVYVVRDDTGQWGRHMSKSITHQNRPNYWAKKVLDLSALSPEVWAKVKTVRLSVYFMVHDYSWRAHPPANGLDEAFEIVVNGRVHRYPTNCGAPVFLHGKPPAMDWYDFPIPKSEIVRGRNVIIIRKASSKKNDDYLYLGIDNSARRGNSAVSYNAGKSWRQDELTVPGGNGEYMVRLYLLARPAALRVRWRPGAERALDDPAGLILYAGAHDAKIASDGAHLRPGQSARLEWRPGALDRLEPVQAAIEAEGPATLAWLDSSGKPTRGRAGARTARLPANRRFTSSGLVVAAARGPVVLKQVTLSASASCHPQPRRIDMCPRIAAPKGRPAPRRPACRSRGGRIELENAGLRAVFTRGSRLQLVSLYNEYAAAEMATDASKIDLFLVEVDGKRYAGSRDFRLAAVRPVRNGFAADLVRSDPALRATLTATIDEEGLRLALRLQNAGSRPVDFKLAFPHLAGLTASGAPAGDYYFFPWGGGVIADTPAIIRRGYGDHEALYQLMDIFSPARGAGLYVRADDAEGWHKVLALRKYVPGQSQIDAQKLYMRTAPEFKWTNPLDAVEGIGFAYEYLRRTRGPGGSFAPAPAVLAAHPGDWHAAMRTYADWAHKVWKFRPYPSRLKNVHNMIAAGWGRGVLFKNGKYRTDFIKPMTDCIELMSWWDWSPLGPWRTPFDQVRQVLGEAKYKRWLPYFVKDPVTGQTMWNNQPGDYDGYNERFGGLPAFRKAIETYKRMGALVTLYTDPIRCSDTSKMGRKYGKLWGVVRPDGKYVKNYEVWNMCHDVLEYRKWVAATMARVLRETGADGIRLDEYGHRGWACFSKLHKHTYAEWGVTQWQKAIADTCRRVHAAMDEVNPRSVLTTEHPGYDYLMQYLEGCITYDLTVQATRLRPLECNLQRFYFPECKAYELDHRGADLQSKKKFWNAVESFGRYWPRKMYLILKQNEDAYQSRLAQPLIPALKRFVYANRFDAPGHSKRIYHLYNAAGHTLEGPVLALPLRPDEHLFDLLHSRPLAARRSKGKAVLALYLERGDIACVAALPRRMAVRRKGMRLRVEVRGPIDEGELHLCDAQGESLLSRPLAAPALTLDLTPFSKRAAAVKLLRRGLLVDAVSIPLRGE